jgi:hypothetical protein
MPVQSPPTAALQVPTLETNKSVLPQDKVQTSPFNPPVQLNISLLVKVLLLVAQAPKDGTKSTEMPTGKLSVMKMISKNATTTSTLEPLVQEHQETLSPTPTLLLLENK